MENITLMKIEKEKSFFKQNKGTFFARMIFWCVDFDGKMKCGFVLASQCAYGRIFIITDDGT